MSHPIPGHINEKCGLCEKEAVDCHEALLSATKYMRRAIREDSNTAKVVDDIIAQAEVHGLAEANDVSAKLDKLNAKGQV